MIRGPDEVVGAIAGKPLFVVQLGRDTMRRVRELTLAGQAPTWIEHDASSNLERVATTDPDWFVDLERIVRTARP